MRILLQKKHKNISASGNYFDVSELSRYGDVTRLISIRIELESDFPPTSHNTHPEYSSHTDSGR